MSDYYPERTDFGPLFQQAATPREAGRAAASACVAAAERRGFDADAARAAVLELLADGRARSGEEITDHCERLGLVPHDARAFGSVIGGLSRRGLIEAVGFATRRKGHGTAGARVWQITSGGTLPGRRGRGGVETNATQGG
jgi:hypothetical protein